MRMNMISKWQDYFIMFNDWIQKGCTLSKVAVAKTELFKPLYCLTYVCMFKHICFVLVA